MIEDVTDVPTFSDRSYEELAVGERWGPFTESLDAETSARLRGALTAPAPGESAPLGVLPLLTLRALRRALGGIIPGGVLIRQHFALLEPLPADATASTEVWVSAQQQRPSGFYTTFTFTIAHDGRQKALVDWMILAPQVGEDAAA